MGIDHSFLNKIFVSFVSLWFPVRSLLVQNRRCCLSRPHHPDQVGDGPFHIILDAQLEGEHVLQGLVIFVAEDHGALGGHEDHALDVRAVQADDEVALAQAVKSVYSVQRDDEALRQIVEKPREERWRFFDALRKNYPIRREFHNTTVIVDEPGGALIRKLLGIGFKVKGRER